MSLQQYNSRSQQPLPHASRSSGANYALILSRSVDFIVYWALLSLQFYSQRDIRLMLSVVRLERRGCGAQWRGLALL